MGAAAVYTCFAFVFMLASLAIMWLTLRDARDALADMIAGYDALIAAARRSSDGDEIADELNRYAMEEFERIFRDHEREFRLRSEPQPKTSQTDRGRDD